MLERTREAPGSLLPAEAQMPAGLQGKRRVHCTEIHQVPRGADFLGAKVISMWISTDPWKDD